MLRIIRENRRLRKENEELRKVIEEALQDLLDPECPPGVRILSTSIRLENVLKKDPTEVSSSGGSRKQNNLQPYYRARRE